MICVCVIGNCQRNEYVFFSRFACDIPILIHNDLFIFCLNMLTWSQYKFRSNRALFRWWRHAKKSHFIWISHRKQPFLSNNKCTRFFRQWFSITYIHPYTQRHITGIHVDAAFQTQKLIKLLTFYCHNVSSRDFFLMWNKWRLCVISLINGVNPICRSIQQRKPSNVKPIVLSYSGHVLPKLTHG